MPKDIKGWRGGRNWKKKHQEQREAEVDLRPLEHKTALKGFLKSFFVPG